MNEKASNELLMFVSERVAKAREANQRLQLDMLPLCSLQTGGGLQSCDILGVYLRDAATVDPANNLIESKVRSVCVGRCWKPLFVSEQNKPQKRGQRNLCSDSLNKAEKLQMSFVSIKLIGSKKKKKKKAFCSGFISFESFHKNEGYCDPTITGES